MVYKKFEAEHFYDFNFLKNISLFISLRQVYCEFEALFCLLQDIHMYTMKFFSCQLVSRFFIMHLKNGGIFDIIPI